jgi:drug/metabolite transporter (DMT)-like permease
VTGYGAAALAIAIWSAYPVATRAGITGPFAAQDLIALRFGVGALLFLPFLLLQFRDIRPVAWARGVPLTLLQGIGMATLVIGGLQFAPASHAAALVPGVSPAWVALLGYVFFARRPAPRVVTGSTLCVCGVLVLAWWNAGDGSVGVLVGDAMFIAASALGAGYVLQLRRWGVGAIQGAAIVSVYSALIVVPWYLGTSSGLWVVAPAQLLWQALWQGCLIGCVALIALNHAIARLGPERSTALVALVPVLTALLGVFFLGEVPSLAEISAFVAISAGVSICSIPYAGSPAASSAAAKRSAWTLSRPG